MQLFGVLRIKVVRRAKELDKKAVLANEMELREAKIVANTWVNEDVFIVVEPVQSILQRREGIIAMDGILCQVYKVDDSRNGADKTVGC